MSMMGLLTTTSLIRVHCGTALSARTLIVNRSIGVDLHAVRGDALAQGAQAGRPQYCSKRTTEK